MTFTDSAEREGRRGSTFFVVEEVLRRDGEDERAALDSLRRADVGPAGRSLPPSQSAVYPATVWETWSEFSIGCPRTRTVSRPWTQLPPTVPAASDRASSREIGVQISGILRGPLAVPWIGPRPKPGDAVRVRDGVIYPANAPAIGEGRAE